MKHLLAETVAITKEAGAIIMGYYTSSFAVRDKKPDNPVTDADYAADAYLKDKLTALLPESGWLSEETVDNPIRLEKRYVWVVDPLDGTKEFVMGIPEFSVSVGLVEDGAPILGVVYNPASEELYATYKGEGVTLNGERVTATPKGELLGAKVDASRSEMGRGEFAPFEDVVELKIMGSIAYKLARVAAGQADATWSRGPKNEWDICAGVVLIQEAGGVCVNLDTMPYVFNRANPKVKGVIADNGHLHGVILEALAPYGAARTD